MYSVPIAIVGVRSANRMIATRACSRHQTCRTVTMFVRTQELPRRKLGRNPVGWANATTIGSYWEDRSVATVRLVNGRDKKARARFALPARPVS